MSAAFARRRARTSPSAPNAAMNCVPLTSERPSFARSSIGSSPRRSSASAPGSSSPSTHASPSPTSGSARCASGARSPLAPTDPRLGHVREHARGSGTRAAARRSRRARPNSPSRACSRAGASPRGRSRPGRARRRRTRGCAAGVAEARPASSCGIPSRDEPAEARVDAVRVLALRRAPRASTTSRAARIRSRARPGERSRRTFEGDGPDVLGGELLAGERDRRCHEPSLISAGSSS